MPGGSYDNDQRRDAKSMPSGSNAGGEHHKELKGEGEGDKRGRKNNKGEMNAMDTQAEINRLQDEDLEAYRRMHNQTEKTKAVGHKTLQNLGEQGEKLDDINRRLDSMDKDLSSAERDLDDLKAGCCGCGQKIKRQKGDKYRDNYRKKSGESSANSASEDIGKKKHKKGKKKDARSTTPLSQRHYVDEREREMAEYDRAIDANIQELKAQANAMSAEIDRQNKQIGTTTAHAKRNSDRVGQLNTAAESVLKSK
ncbi:synaptosomal-associated protein 25-A-like [Symsagittifera roscoffensis]|uniref:synaptosomal-associated protein 25-A-like n=1 Tax=Symsagittifera roscoffensis TaxID=84072 RepID=UPI00307BBB26